MPSFFDAQVSQCMPVTPHTAYGQTMEDIYPSGHMTTQPTNSAEHRLSSSCYDNRTHIPNGIAKQRQHQHQPPPTMSYSAYSQDLLSCPPYLTSRTEAIQHAPIGAPLLAPMRAPEHALQDCKAQAVDKFVPPAAETKEEKTGGVAAHLDYEMDEMVDFVSEMVQGMYDIFNSEICLADIDITRSVLSSKSSPNRDFRKYVSQVLSSTRLPSSTILLGLLYLSERMAFLSKKGHYGQGTRDMYSMLTIALILGSKFLDDNTFQNRSWSEVSSISVNELNFLEIQWLVDMDWDLHIDQDDPEGLQLWLQHWEQFRARKVDIALANSMKQANISGYPRQRRQQQNGLQLPPLNTDFLLSQPPDNSRAGFVNQQHGPWNVPQHLQWHPSSAQNTYSPPSAPETGPNTPDAYGLLNSYSYAPQPVHPVFKPSSASNMFSSNAAPTGYATPYISHYSHYAHGDYCDSGFCTSREHYLWASEYAPQTVAA